MLGGDEKSSRRDILILYTFQRIVSHKEQAQSIKWHGVVLRSNHFIAGICNHIAPRPDVKGRRALNQLFLIQPRRKSLIHNRLRTDAI